MCLSKGSRSLEKEIEIFQVEIEIFQEDRDPGDGLTGRIDCCLALAKRRCLSSIEFEPQVGDLVTDLAESLGCCLIAQKHLNLSYLNALSFSNIYDA